MSEYFLYVTGWVLAIHLFNFQQGYVPQPVFDLRILARTLAILR